MNKVVFGVNSLDVSAEGKTVGEVAREAAGLLNMDPNQVTPKIDGRDADFNTTILDGQEVRFERPMGGKGIE